MPSRRAFDALAGQEAVAWARSPLAKAWRILLTTTVRLRAPVSFDP